MKINKFSRKRKNKPETPKKEYPKLSKRERMEICKGCDKFLPNTKRCSVCGCFMEIKTSIGIFHCPLDKW